MSRSADIEHFRARAAGERLSAARARHPAAAKAHERLARLYLARVQVLEDEASRLRPGAEGLILPLRA